MGDRGASTNLTPESLVGANDLTSVNAKVFGLEASITSARNEERWVDASLELERWVELTRYQHRTTGVPACQPKAARRKIACYTHQPLSSLPPPSPPRPPPPAPPPPPPLVSPLALHATLGSRAH